MSERRKNTKAGCAAEQTKEQARKTKRPDNLAEFFAQSPLRRSGLKVKRPRDRPRKVDL